MKRVLSIFSFAFAVFAASSAWALMDRGDGIHTESWFLNGTTFYEMKAEATDAASADKGLILVWEQQGCGSCLKLHEVNFQDAKLTKYLKANFHMMSMNIFGEMPIVDFDGVDKPEKDMAARLAVHRSPTTQFYDGAGNLVFTLPGYLDPERYLAAAMFVKEKGYEDDAVKRNFLVWFAKNKTRVGQTYADGS